MSDRRCELCEEAWHGLIRTKIELEQRLAEMTRNHDEALRLYSQWRSRAEKAEGALQAQGGSE